jgi:hypothetical protein
MKMSTNMRWIAGLLIVCGVIGLVAQQPITIQTLKGVALSVGNGTQDTGTQRVTLASDSTGQVTLAAGAATIGTVNLASGSQSNPVPQTSSTYATTSYDLSATAATNIKNGAGNVYGWFGFNPNTSTCFLQFYNSASPSLGASVLHPFGVLAGASFNVTPGSVAMFNMGTAISTGQTTTATGSSQCSSPMVITILYD